VQIVISQSTVLSASNRGSQFMQQLAKQFVPKSLQKTSSLAQWRIHLLSNGSDMPQGTVPSCYWSNGPSKKRTVTQSSRRRMQLCRSLAAGSA